MSSPAAHEHRVARAPASQPVLPDEILEIFLLLDGAEDLARASAACATFRRVVSARRFLRRFKCLHRPPILGVFESDPPAPFHPAETPHRSAPAARALAQAADFTFSFLPAPNFWRVCDARDGRVLLRRPTSGATTAFADLVVCDPLHRRHVQLPRIPDDLVAAAVVSDVHVFDSFFDPTTDKQEQQKEEQDLLFRVICTVRCQHNLVTFHFSSATGKWSGVTLDQTTPLKDVVVNARYLRYYGLGCFYWTFLNVEGLFILDMHQMKFSAVDLPTPTSSCWHPMGHAIVELGGGRLGLFVTDGFSKRHGILELYSKTLGNICVGTEEWQHDKMIPLPEMECLWNIHGAAEGYLLLQAWLSHKRESHYFTLDIKTLLVERLCVSRHRSKGDRLYASLPPHWGKGARPYANFPPQLSLPSI